MYVHTSCCLIISKYNNNITLFHFFKNRENTYLNEKMNSSSSPPTSILSRQTFTIILTTCGLVLIILTALTRFEQVTNSTTTTTSLSEENNNAINNNVETHHHHQPIIISTATTTISNEKQFTIDILQANHVIFENDKIYVNKTTSEVLIDVGLSMSAPNTEHWLRKDPNRLVFGFEPNPHSFGLILSGAGALKYPWYDPHVNAHWVYRQFFPINVAVDEITTRARKFYMAAGDPGVSSLHAPAEGQNVVILQQEIYVPTIRLDRFLELLPWSSKLKYITHLKTDCQGNDLSVIKSAGSLLSEKVVCVSPEWWVSGYVYQHSESELQKYLSSQGFEALNDATWINKKFIHLKGKVDCFTTGE
jgi:hypothetical protein